MTDIPDDVMKAAVNAVNEAIRDERTGLAVKMSIKHQPFYEFVARAIMAEREQCAKVAESGLGKTVTSIAAAIRKGQP